MIYDVAIIGGGAAGLACAAALAEHKNIKTAVIEAGDRLGKKLAATGNGQGNISNADMSPEHYHGGGAHLAQKIACADTNAEERLFDCLLTTDSQGRIYPAGKQASALVDCLIKKISSADLFLGTKVVDIDRGFTLALSDGSEIRSRFVVLCTGGKAQKQFKTDGSAYALACKFGHTLTPLYPSLVQLKTDTAHIRTLKGIRADCVITALVGGKAAKSVRGDVIFTEYGISGNAVFFISSYITDKPDASVSIEFLPDVPAEKILSNLALRRKAGYRDGELLSGSLHNQLGRAVVARAGGDLNAITRTVKNFRLGVTGTLGFDYAQVTRGGINADEVTEELESKLVKNLFFAGEILDADGDCGGYNLHWAFAGGIHVARTVSERL